MFSGSCLTLWSSCRGRSSWVFYFSYVCGLSWFLCSFCRCHWWTVFCDRDSFFDIFYAISQLAAFLFVPKSESSEYLNTWFMFIDSKHWLIQQRLMNLLVDKCFCVYMYISSCNVLCYFWVAEHIYLLTIFTISVIVCLYVLVKFLFGIAVRPIFGKENVFLAFCL